MHVAREGDGKGVGVYAERPHARGMARALVKVVRASLEERIAPRAIFARPQTLPEGGYGGGGAMKGALVHDAVSSSSTFVYRRFRVRSRSVMVWKWWGAFTHLSPPPRAGVVTAASSRTRAIVYLERPESFT